MAGINRWWIIAGALLILSGIGVSAVLMTSRPSEPPPPPPEAGADFARQVHALCSGCHAYPPPETFPRADWEREVFQGFDFAMKAGQNPAKLPSRDRVVAHFRDRAPERLPPPVIERATTPCPVRF